MKKYIPLDFDEKGKVVLGREKNTPTPNGTIPAIFIPGGSDEGKQGLKSISISPAITTTPALDSLFPIYYDDLTEEQKQSGEVILYAESTGYVPEGTYTVTITPTGDWYALDTTAGIIGEKGEPISVEVFQQQKTELFQFNSAIVSDGNTEETSTKIILPYIRIRATV